jgi:UDP-glucose 4-epimerase
VTGREFEVRYTDRRSGDPAAAVASNELARDVLQWNPKKSGLEEIVADAWAAYQSQ